MVDFSEQQWVGALFFTFGIGMMIPLGIAIVNMIPTVALPVFYLAIVAFVYRTGNTLRESLVFVAVPTLFVSGVYIIVLSRGSVLPQEGVFAGLIVAAAAAVGVGYLYYGKIT